MNAPIPPNDPAGIDELISAYVDGVAAPDEIALVEGSAEFMSRVESMRSVSAMLGATVTPPPGAVREDHLAAALGEFDLLFGDGATDTETGATVTPLPQLAEPELVAAASAPALKQQAGVASLAEARERKRPRRLNMVAAAAAAVAILFAGVVAVGLNTGGESMDVVAEASSDAVEPAISSAIESSDQMVLPEDAEAAPAPTAAAARAFEDDAMDAMADDADDAMEEAAMDDDAMDESMADEEAMEEEEADAEAAFAAPVEESDADAAGATQSQPFGFLGSFATIDELATAANLDLNEVPATKSALDRTALLPPTDCIDIAQELTGLDAPTLLSTGFLDGNPVELHAAGDDQILILSSTDCTTIESIPAS